ncbi:MAG: YkgJ family cysteine cluster protein [Planctomycetaceae bacterium]|nr:YkgJ family cysteine cluster protein [Planctomycetaceae bacterium]
MEDQNHESKTSEPWYAEGLKFECTQCGNCCTGAPGAVWISEDELQEIADHLNKSIGEVRLMHTRIVRGKLSLREYANGECIFFNGASRGCTIYEARPIQCRTWPFWRSNIASPESWQEAQRECPGAGQGNFVSLEEIERRASQIEL